MSAPGKYYYQGYECNAVQQQGQGWFCTVENVRHPFAFEVSHEHHIQENLEREVDAYINRCHDKGVEPKHSFMASVRKDQQTAIGEVMRKNRSRQEIKQKQKEREFQRSPWRYAVAATLVGIPALGYFMLATFNRVVPFTLFFPYRADVSSKRLPLLTVLVCVICWVVFIGQVISEKRINDDCDRFMELEASRDYAANFYDCSDLEYLRRSGEKSDAALRDIHAFYVRYSDAETEAEKEQLLSRDELTGIMQKTSPLYQQQVAPAFDDDVMYWPNRGDITGVVTSMFAHADFEHILFNLIFFFAFAATVERIAGPGFYLSLFMVYAVFDTVLGADSVLGSGLELGVPSLGLSGVCSAFLGALLVLKHDVRINTFFWFIFAMRTFRVPVWFLAAWYISFDVMNMLEDDSWGGTGYIAHVIGAFSGIGTALLYKMWVRQRPEPA